MNTQSFIIDQRLPDPIGEMPGINALLQTNTEPVH